MVPSIFPRFAAVLLLLFCFAPAMRGQQQTTTRGTSVEQPPAAAAVPNGKYYALVIGINGYPPPLPTLKTAESDAQAVAKMLHDDYGFEVKVVLGHDATRNTILSALNQYETQLQANDNLLIYYAGHGYENKTTGKAYWLPVDADSSSNPNRIIADDITSEMAAIPARHVLLISDSCYSGGLTRDTDIIPQSHGQEAFLQKMLNGHSRTLMASGGDEPVSDAGKDGHSAFAYAVLQALGDTHQALFTASDLFYDGVGGVQRRVSGNTQQVPQYAVIRNSGHDEGDFVFTRKNASSAEIAAKLAALGPAFNRGAALYESKHYFAALPLLASACDQKSFRACSYLGLMYEDGKGVPKDLPRAITLFTKACDNGDGKGCNDLALLYNHGDGVPKDVPRSITLFNKACSGNYAVACGTLGNIYGFQNDPPDFARAAEFFQRACDGAVPMGCRGRGVMYETGLGQPPDPEQAIAYFSKGCEMGDGLSCVNEGAVAYKKSPPDRERYYAAYRKACDLGAAEGCGLLGLSEADGTGLSAANIEAASLYGQTCDNDAASVGCDMLAIAYENGWGVPVDYAQAAYLFSVGCDASSWRACRDLGQLYESGRGVTKDYAKALDLYRKGCDSKNADSCSSLASLYVNGNGVAKDVAHAIDLYRGACDAGSGDGCRNLGDLYKNGVGVAQDTAQAAAMYHKACDHSDALACIYLRQTHP